MNALRPINTFINMLRIALVFGLISLWFVKASLIPHRVYAAEQAPGVLIPLVTPTYAVLIDDSLTGISGVCVNCDVSNRSNAIDSDTSNAASITIPVGATGTGSIAVQDTTSTFPGGYFAGFVIRDTGGLGTQLVNALTISTYNNGSLQETSNGTSLLDAPLVPGQRMVGFTTAKAFDEIRFTTGSAAGLLTNIGVAYAVVRAPVFATPLVPPTYTLQVDSSISGVCVLCSVSNRNNVIDSDTSNAAAITIPVGVASTGTIAVRAPANTFSAGDFAGFVIRDVGGLGTRLLDAVTISTYNDGVAQETQTSSNLLNIGATPQQMTLGFITTKPFDEIRVTVGSVGRLAANINVYNAVVSDAANTDNDNDGIPNAVEGMGDVDGDGAPNYLDTDSDGDGISDTIEAGSTPTAPVDTDNDGAPDYLDTDSDNDTVPDKTEGGTADTDGDGTLNFRDNDDDGDGVLTVGEDRNGNGDPTDDDADGDSVADYLDPDPVTDYDGDGILDTADPDDDNDGILDVTEGDGTVDTDNDGTPDSRDTDSDSDGITDLVEGTGDPDGDGIPNYLDLDSDSDGITDRVEGTGDPDGDGIPNYLDLDSDGDDIPDSVEGATTDTDSDGTPDRLDLDSDGDGIADQVEGIVDTDNDGVPNYRDLDSDNDRVPDAVEGATTDTDGDGAPNYRDNDDDGDKVLTVNEDRNGNGNPTDDDSDSDGTPDYLDPDPVVDNDGDGMLDTNDPDDDNDGIPDTMEGDGTVDTDNDGIPDSRDADSDGDGISDTIEGMGDADGDGIPNYRDLDSDGDGIPDRIEGLGDEDGDGVPNFLDPRPGVSVQPFKLNLPIIFKAR